MAGFTAYKFRPLGTNEQEARLLEILHTGALWSADWRELNDPMEGMFRSARERRDVEMIIDFKLGYRVCSLAGTWRAVPLWAYYASNFAGVAVEISLPRLDAPGRGGLRNQDEIISKVDYRADWAFLDPGDCAPYQAAQRVLLSKHSAWRHEQEIRVLTQHHHYRPEIVQRLLFGPRIADRMKMRLANECRGLGIECAEIKLSNRGLTSSRFGPALVGHERQGALV
jgi:hypothetical protein